MKKKYELLIIGAGPAGMAAACEAVKHGVDVCVIDDQPNPGGQIYRDVDQSTDQVKRILGDDYRKGAVLVEEFKRSGGHYIPEASVWYLDENHQVGVLHSGKSYFVNPDILLIATGAQERAMPIQGWQLPNVMYAGAGQILLKSHGLIPRGKLVLAGSGPLLLLLANQYLQAGVEIEAVLDTTPAGNYFYAIGRFIPALKGYEYLLKGTGLLWNLKRAGVPYFKEVQGLSAEGSLKLDSVVFERAKKGLGYSSNIRIEADYLMLHQGVIPNIRLPLAAGCLIEWLEEQRCWSVKTDLHGQSMEKTYVVGDAARIVGAMASRYQGQLSGLHIAYRLGKLSKKAFHYSEKKFAGLIGHHISIRPFLDRLYAPSKEYLVPETENTIVCRCEEVTAKQIRDAVSLGCTGPNQVKSFTRCGMGPCQGAQCGNTVSWILSDELNKTMDEVGMLRVRPPLSPITLGQIADI